VTEPGAVAGRIEIELQRPAIGVPEAVLHEIRSHARESVPDECCGLVFGVARPGVDGASRFGRVYRCHNVMDRMNQDDPLAYPRTNRNAFYIDPGELLRAAREAEAEGLDVTVVYHSHVGAAAYFSEMDQAFATQPGFPFPNADHLVVSVLGRQVREIALFRAGADGTLVGHPVEPISS
jgi:proteasome lid subunit RPN8/RPN11